MDQICALIERYIPAQSGWQRMLRTYFLRHWFNLSGPGAEEALCKSRSMCRFADINLGRGPAPDVTARTRISTSSKTRAKMEHVFGVMKRMFGFAKGCYCGLGKNMFCVP